MRRLLGAAAVLGVLTVAASGAGAPANAAACTGLSAWLGGCRTTTTTTPPPPPPPPPPAPAPAPGPAPVAPVLDVLASARQMLDLANVERAAAGLARLEWRDDAAQLGTAHSQRMADAGTIFHNDQLFSAPVRSSLAAKTLGENVGYGGSVAQIHGALMNSAGHRANILSPKFRVAGVGIVRNGGTLYMTQVFIEPSGAAPKALPKAATARPTTTAAPKPRATRTAAPRPTAPASAQGPTTPPSTEAPPTTITEAPPTTAAPPDPEPELAFGGTAAVAPAESDGGNAARALAVSLLLAVAVWAWRLRARVALTIRA